MTGVQRGSGANYTSVGAAAGRAAQVQAAPPAADVRGDHELVAAGAHDARGVGEPRAARHAAQGDDHAGDHGVDTAATAGLPGGGDAVHQVLQQRAGETDLRICLQLTTCDA